ncbi:MAG TPA: hypothetical protein EYN06_01245 [Myxococcales bacterium]|nr:hypothetical protein [Myxococcales bacterium]
MLTEFPVTGAIALRSGGELERFFSSRVLHRAIQDGTSLVLAFGRWIAKEQRIRKAECKASNQVELGMAKLRRPQAAIQDHPISLAPHVSTISVFGGTLALYQQLLSQLAGKNTDLATAALDPKFRLTLPLLEAGTEHLLIERKTDGQMAMEKLPDGLAAMLSLAERGCTLNELLDCALATGAEGNEAQEIVDELYSDGLLADTRKP